jgi:hypothetical protein
MSLFKSDKGDIMNYMQAVEAYNALKFKDRNDFYGWHKFLMDLLPEKKELEDMPAVRLDLNSGDKISNLAKHYIKRDLGTEYEILPKEPKERRRMEFCDKHRLVSSLEPVPEAPEELLKLYIDVHRKRWSKNGRINKKQVHTVYDEVREEQWVKTTPSWIDENWKRGIEEINRRMYEDLIVTFIPQGQLGLFDWASAI